MVSCALFTQNVMVMTAFAMLANGLTIPGLSKRGDGVLKLDFDVIRSKSPPNATDFFEHQEALVRQKRSGVVPTSLSNELTQYVIAFELGSDKQQISAGIDTGSSDLWVPATGADCDSCTSKGSFNSKTSTTFKSTGKAFNITYADKTNTIGTLGTDTINVGGVSVDNFEFAIASESSVRFGGVFGISFTGQEAMSKSEGTYTNFPALLKEEGIIGKNAYSLYLDSPQSQTGSIIFGGIDHAKYNGTLATSPIALYPFQAIEWHGIENADGSTIQGSGHPIVFDSGTSTAGFPKTIIDKINAQLGATPTDQGINKAPCDQGDKRFTFDFADGSVSVPYTSFLFPFPIDDQQNCAVWPIFDTTDYAVDILGDIFLREAYVVFNLDDKTISYANAVYTDETNIQPI